MVTNYSQNVKHIFRELVIFLENHWPKFNSHKNMCGDIRFSGFAMQVSDITHQTKSLFHTITNASLTGILMTAVMTGTLLP